MLPPCCYRGEDATCAAAAGFLSGVSPLWTVKGHQAAGRESNHMQPPIGSKKKWGLLNVTIRLCLWRQAGNASYSILSGRAWRFAPPIHIATPNSCLPQSSGNLNHTETATTHLLLQLRTFRFQMGLPATQVPLHLKMPYWEFGTISLAPPT